MLIDMPVEMVTRRLRSGGDERGMLVYGYKFRPVMQAGPELIQNLKRPPLESAFVLCK